MMTSTCHAAVTTVPRGRMRGRGSSVLTAARCSGKLTKKSRPSAPRSCARALLRASRARRPNPTRRAGAGLSRATLAARVVRLGTGRRRTCAVHVELFEALLRLAGRLESRLHPPSRGLDRERDTALEDPQVAQLERLLARSRPADHRAAAVVDREGERGRDLSAPQGPWRRGAAARRRGGGRAPRTSLARSAARGPTPCARCAPA